MTPARPDSPAQGARPAQAGGSGTPAPRAPLPGVRVDLRDVAAMSWQLSTLVNAGVPVLRCIEVCASQTRSVRMASVLRAVCLEVEGGASLSSAMSRYPRVFDRLYTSLIQAGETGGALDVMCSKLALFVERRYELRGQLRGALAYPAFLVLSALGATAFLLVYTLPKLMDVFTDLGAELPAITRGLMFSGAFLQGNWIWILPVVLGTAAAGVVWHRTPGGHRLIDRLWLSLPGIGPVAQQISMARFAHTMSVLQAGGVPLLTTLEMARDVVGNDLLSSEIEAVRRSVEGGQSLGESVRAARFIPPLVSQMITVGEETGKLDEMLMKVSVFYDRQVELILKTATRLIEPLMIAVMALVVGFVAMAIFVPLADLTTQVR
ncbi:MAG: type II secretion system F family protein [Planctomycetes bacterium]|nr:type II secretion system F family protein [Planctomycetota bacterium]